MITVYGLKNCDTCRKALKWLAAQAIDCEFKDVRADGVAVADLKRWAAKVGWETLLNRRSTTWRQLRQSEREGIGEAKAIALMAANPTLIKRPVMESGETCSVGFGAAQQAAVKGAAPD
jgi:Spx/MgsR family transcriptional regulator